MSLDIQFEDDEILEEKNNCSECGKRGSFNYEDRDYGVRCKGHKLEGMVNILNKEYCEKRFIKNVEKIGGKVVGSYVNNSTPVECMCPKGHKCNPRPGHIKRGQGMCRICANNDSETSKNNFISNIKAFGGEVTGKYINALTPVDCICPKGHKCNPWPCSIQQGVGMCLICSGNDPETSKKNFITNIELLGGKVIGEYINSLTAVECIYPKDHKCNPTPNNVQKRQGMCLICSGNDPETSKNNFITNIELLGGKVIGEYINALTTVECLCSKGHKCNPRPSEINRRGICCPKCGKSSFSKLSFEYLDSICLSQKILLQTSKSDEGEFKIPYTKYKVDGYHRESNTVYEFHGCYWHGCPICFDPEEMNDTSKKTFEELYDKTLYREEMIKSKGYNLVVMWECEWTENLVL